MRNLKLILPILFVCLLTTVCQACPTCKLALEEGPNHSQQGYAYSIMFMMSMPFAIALGWTIFIVRVMRQRRLMESLEPAV